MEGMRLPDGNFSFDFDEHFGSLMRACEGEFRFRGGTQTEPRQWQAAFRDRLRTRLGLANVEKDLAGFVPLREAVLQRGPGAVHAGVVAHPHRADRSAAGSRRPRAPSRDPVRGGKRMRRRRAGSSSCTDLLVRADARSVTACGTCTSSGRSRTSAWTATTRNGCGASSRRHSPPLEASLYGAYPTSVSRALTLPGSEDRGVRPPVRRLTHQPPSHRSPR